MALLLFFVESVLVFRWGMWYNEENGMQQSDVKIGSYQPAF